MSCAFSRLFRALSGAAGLNNVLNSSAVKIGSGNAPRSNATGSAWWLPSPSDSEQDPAELNGGGSGAPDPSPEEDPRGERRPRAALEEIPVPPEFQTKRLKIEQEDWQRRQNLNLAQAAPQEEQNQGRRRGNPNDKYEFKVFADPISLPGDGPGPLGLGGFGKFGPGVQVGLLTPISEGRGVQDEDIRLVDMIYGANYMSRGDSGDVDPVAESDENQPPAIVPMDLEPEELEGAPDLAPIASPNEGGAEAPQAE